MCRLGFWVFGPSAKRFGVFGLVFSAGINHDSSFWPGGDRDKDTTFSPKGSFPILDVHSTQLRVLVQESFAVHTIVCAGADDACV